MRRLRARPFQALFSAPADFLGTGFAKLPASVRLAWRTVWHRRQLRPDPHLQGWITNTGWDFRLSGELLKMFPSLRIVITPSTGTDHLDAKALRDRGIRMGTLLDRRKDLEKISASAEFAFFLLLGALRRIPRILQTVRAGQWRRDRESWLRGRELMGRKVGLVGMGRIGRRLAAYCRAFGAHPVYFDPHISRHGRVPRVRSLPALFSECDVVVLCCAFTKKTRHLIRRRHLIRLRQGAAVVNVARGEIVHERELYGFLLRRPDVVYCADVVAGEVEGREYASPLWRRRLASQVFLTPHVAGCTAESQAKAAAIAVGLLGDFVRRQRGAGKR